MATPAAWNTLIPSSRESLKRVAALICRLSGDLRSILLASGQIQVCQDLPGFCRVTVSVRLNGSVREFINRASGNHHALVHGDHRDELQALNDLLRIETIRI